jgi:ketosteroid isomerase-like protein
VVSRRLLGQVVIAVVAAVVLYAAWGWLFTSDEARVRAAIEELATTLSSEASDPLGQVAAIGALRRQLAADVVVNTGGGAQVRGRDAVAGFWQRVRTSSGAIRVRVFDVEVAVAPDGRSADASGVAEVTREPNGVPERELREVQATFVAEDGEWRLARATTVEAVTPP